MKGLVLHITAMTSTKFGGMERYLLEVARQCQEKGYRMCIQYEAPPTSQEYVRRLAEVEADIVVEQLLRSAFDMGRGLRAMVAEKRPEIIQTHFIPRRLLPLVWMIGNAYGVRRCLAMVHIRWDPKRSFKNRLAFLGFDYVLAVSEASASNLVASGTPNRSVRTHYMGLIDPPQFNQSERLSIRRELSIPQNAIIFGNIAFDHPVKGVDLLLKAFKQVVRMRPEAHLLQLGVDINKSSIADVHSHVANVHWLGIRDDAPRFLSAIDVYVQPSRSEGLPLAILEAMSMSRPIIASAVGGVPEAVIHDVTGLLVDAEDLAGLVEAMVKIIRDFTPATRHQMGLSGERFFSEKFDGPRSVSSLIEQYYS
jgi:glycosyltransferase involved in cell wall biosynthesis